MIRSRRLPGCCSGGAYPEGFSVDAGYWRAKRDIDRAVEVEADVLISVCQQCEQTLTGAEHRDPEAREVRMRAIRIVELACKAMDEVRDQEGR